MLLALRVGLGRRWCQEVLIGAIFAREIENLQRLKWRTSVRWRGLPEWSIAVTSIYNCVDYQRDEAQRKLGQGDSSPSRNFVDHLCLKPNSNYASYISEDGRTQSWWLPYGIFRCHLLVVLSTNSLIPPKQNPSKLVLRPSLVPLPILFSSSSLNLNHDYWTLDWSLSREMGLHARERMEDIQIH